MATNNFNPIYSGPGSSQMKPIEAFDPIAEGAEPFDPISEGATPVETTPVQEDTRSGFQKAVEGIGSIAGLDVLGKKAAQYIAPAWAKFTGESQNVVNATKDIAAKEAPTWGQTAGGAVKLAATVIPVGKVITSGLALRGAIEGGTYGLGQALVDKQNLPEAARTAGTYALGGSILSKASGYIANRVPKLLSIFSGENAGTIEAALANPKAADIGIKGGDAALRNAVNQGAEMSTKLRTNFINSEQAAIKTLSKNATDKGIMYSKKVAQDTFNKVLEDNNIGVGRKLLDFSQSKAQINPGEVGKIVNADAIIKGWDDWSLSGVHKLKQIIGGLTKFPAEGGGTSKSPVLGKVYHSLDEMIKSRLPESGRKIYTQINDKFASQIDLFNEVVDAFNSGDPFSKLANALSGNKDSIRSILEFYENQSGKSVLPLVAGRELAAEKSAAFGFLNPRSWIDFFISPQLQGQIITGVGKGQKSIQKFIPNVSKQAGTVVNQQILNTFLRKPNND